MENLIRIGNNIRIIRQSLGYSQELMAIKLNISQPAYSKMENGKIKICKDNLDTICEILQINPVDLSNFNIKEIIKQFVNIEH